MESTSKREQRQARLGLPGGSILRDSGAKIALKRTQSQTCLVFAERERLAGVSRKVLRFMMSAVCLVLLFVSCENDDSETPAMGMFTVTIENVSEMHDFFQSGVFNTPVGESGPGPALPGHSFSFSFHAGKGHYLSFTTMYGISNDLFYAPADEGVALYDDDGPVTGDITPMIRLWDAGTEVNEEPGVGANTGPQQSGPNTGPAENGTVREISQVNDGFTYPPVEDNIKVMLEYDGTSMFTVTIENKSMSTTPLSPGVWVVHSMPNVLFEEGQADYGHGLEHNAEDGDPAGLGEYLTMHSGYVSPIGPGVWVVYKKEDMPLFTEGMDDYGDGLEALAENGDPAELAASVMDTGFESGIYNTPVGAGGPGPVMPGEKYSFSFKAEAGDYLSFASMLGQSNDLFFAPGDMGIQLFNGSEPVNGEVTDMIMLWDAGTEVNEYPGAGIHQPAQMNGGMDENGHVMMVNDDFTYPAVGQMIKVTITGM